MNSQLKIHKCLGNRRKNSFLSQRSVSLINLNQPRKNPNTFVTSHKREQSFIIAFQHSITLLSQTATSPAFTYSRTKYLTVNYTISQHKAPVQQISYCYYQSSTYWDHFKSTRCKSVNDVSNNSSTEPANLILT